MYDEYDFILWDRTQRSEHWRDFSVLPLHILFIYQYSIINYSTFNKILNTTYVIRMQVQVKSTFENNNNCLNYVLTERSELFVLTRAFVGMCLSHDYGYTVHAGPYSRNFVSGRANPIGLTCRGVWGGMEYPSWKRGPGGPPTRIFLILEVV